MGQGHPHVHPHVRAAVGPRSLDHGVFAENVAEVRVCPGIADDIRNERGEPALGVGPGLVAHHVGVALRGGEDRLLAGEAHPHGPSRGLGQKGEEGLDGEHDLAPEASAHVGALDADLIVRHAQDAGYETEVLDHLGAAADVDDPARVEPGHARFGLEICVLHALGAVGLLGQGGGPGEARLHIPPPEAVVGDHVPLLIHLRGAGLQRPEGVLDQGERLVLNADAGESLFGKVGRLRRHKGHRVPHPTHAALGEHGLVVAGAQKVPPQVDPGDILRGEHGVDAGKASGLPDIEAPDAGVGHRAHKGPPPEHPGKRDIVAEASHPRRLLRGLGRSDGFADQTGNDFIGNHLHLLGKPHPKKLCLQTSSRGRAGALPPSPARGKD